MGVTGNDFKKVPMALETVVKNVLDIELVQMKSDAERPALPFATYDVINPYIRQAYNTSPADGFSIEVQLGIHCSGQQEALQSALVLRAALERSSTIQALASQGVHFEKILDVYNRPTLLVGEAYEYISGIDLQLGIDVSLAPDDTEPLENFEISGMGGSTISI